MIINPQGKVRFSSHPKNLQHTISVKQNDKPSTHFMPDGIDEEILRSINPVKNKVQCQECHGTIEKNPLNGTLIVDYNASSIKQKVRNTTFILMAAGALIVIINLLGGWLFIHYFILKPIHRLGHASHALAKGDWQTRVSLLGNDELAVLGETFNLMANNLQNSLTKLEEDKVFLQVLIDAIPDGLRIIDRDYNMLLVNKAFIEQTGNPNHSWIGKKCYQATQQRDSPCPTDLMNCSLEEVCKTGELFKIVRQQKYCDGTDSNVEISASPMTFMKDGKEMTVMIEAIRDLTQEVRFSHEQRLSELGQLAANVAHEIFNPLSSMELAVKSMQAEFSDQSPSMTNYMKVISQSIEQCIEMTNRLLRISAPSSGNNDLVNICKAIEDVLSLVKWDAEQTNIQVIKAFSAPELRVFASESEIRMLILNLVQNAFHAMPKGGVLKISAIIENKDIVIHFRDNGSGISEENISKIFMPFFSRRVASDNGGTGGTGLGLPIARSTIENYGGTLNVESTLGEGSCFIIKIPQASLTRFKK